MEKNRVQPATAMLRLGAAGAIAALLLSGCPKSTPVVVTPQEQASRVVYNCPNAKTLDVTRLRDQASAIVIVDGTTLQLPRDTAYKSAERYTNRLQTLTLFSNGASFEAIGRSTYGPCTATSTDGFPGADARENNRRTRMENTD